MSYNNDTTQRLDVLDPGTPATQWAQNTQSLLGDTLHTSLPSTASATNTSNNTDTSALANAGGFRSVGQPVGESIDDAAERISRRPGDDIAGDAASGRAAVGVQVPRSAEMNTILGSGAGGASYLGGQAYDGQQGGFGGSTGYERSGDVSGMGGGTVYGQLNPNTGTERGGTYGGATAATGTGMGTNPFRDSRQEGYDAPPGAGAVGTAGLVGAAGGAAYSAGRNDTTYDSGNLDSSDIGATSGPAQADTSGWSAGAGTGNTTRSGTNDLSTGSTGTELPPAQQNTADLIGPEPKWKNASSTVSAPDDTSLPPAGIDTQTSSGAISSEPSARTRAALASDPGSTTTHGVLGGQPKQTGEGQPIVDPLSTGANTDQQSGFGAAQGGQSAGGGAYGAGAGQGGYERGSSDPSQGTGFSGSTGTGTGGVSAEPTARTQAALGRGGY